MMQAAMLAQLPAVRHGFFTRQGGVSTGLYQSLNCGFGSSDDPANIAENRNRCAAWLNVAPVNLVTAHQVHGTRVVEVSPPWAPGQGPQADAMITNRPGVALGILTADCGPILLADGEAGIVGAAHAGWKGAKAGMAEAVVEAMIKLGAAATRIVAVVGPTIGLASYEVGTDFRQSFLEDDPAADRFFSAVPGRRPCFDLQGFLVDRLEGLGLGQVERIAGDTCAEPDRFFSYRRACLQGETDYGRQLSAITLL